MNLIEDPRLPAASAAGSLKATLEPAHRHTSVSSHPFAITPLSLYAIVPLHLSHPQVAFQKN
jgi:hypothetical protein